MKALIPPTLFTLARLGLFLAVVAWVVRQWWEVTVHRNNGPFWGMLNADSWFASDFTLEDPYAESSGWNLWCKPTEAVHFDMMAYIAEAAPSRFQCPGVTGCFHKNINFVRIRHWLIVSTFIAFNLLLHFIYRKRPEAEPCEP